MPGFTKLYGRLRRKLPKTSGEVKGRTLNESQVAETVSLLRKVGGILEIVATDSLYHSQAKIIDHKRGQEEKITEYLTDAHHPNFVKNVQDLRSQLEVMTPQLYVQTIAMVELVYHTLNHANVYFALRSGKELGSYSWIIDAKDRSGPTPWEIWWSKIVLPMIESKTMKEPFIAVQGGDYRWHDKFRTEISEFKKQFVKNSERGDFFDLKPVLGKSVRFSSDPEFGLEAVDILVNAVRRSLAGNFQRGGWLPIRSLMIHRSNEHYIKLVGIGAKELKPIVVPYKSVLKDFTSGGRSMIP